MSYYSQQFLQSSVNTLAIRDGKPAIPTRFIKAFYFPEVKGIVDDVATKTYGGFPHDLMRAIPEDQGTTFAMAHRNWIRPVMPEVGNFPHSYIANGASEIIKDALADFAFKCYPKQPRLLFINGDYEGFTHYAGTHFVVERIGLEELINSFDGIRFEGETKSKLQRLGSAGDCMMLITNPSSINGMLLPAGLIRAIADTGIKMYIDASYVGLIDPNFSGFNYEHENIVMIIHSLSKSFGVYGWRVGICYSQHRMISLEGNNPWFHNPLAFLIGEELVKNIPYGYLHTHYVDQQRKAVEHYNAMYQTNLIDKSDTLLIAYAVVNPAMTKVTANWESYRRVAIEGLNIFRFCLWPYFEYTRQENEEE